MRFWDASALVPLLLEEGASSACRRVLEEDAAMIVWWGTEVECASAIGRQDRAGVLDMAHAQDALDRLDLLGEAWNVIQPLEVVRRTARRLLRLHPLRTADALQLSAAITCAEGEPTVLPFVSLDRRLAEAARREGFPVVEPS